MIVSIYHHFIGFFKLFNDWPRAGMVDSLDLKSSGIYPVPVRVRPRLPAKENQSPFFINIYIPEDAIIVAPVIVNRSGTSL